MAGSSNNMGDGGDIDQLKIYVGNLPPGEALSKEDLTRHFSQFGEVVEVTRPVNKFKKEPFAFAFITFASASVVENLINQKNTEVGSFQLQIKPAKSQVKKPPRQYLVKKRKHSSPSSSSLKASQARAAIFYENYKTLKMSVEVGRSYRCNLVRMETPKQLWLREEGRTEDYFKMKNKMDWHFSREQEPVSAIKKGGICAIKTDKGWARARVVSDKEKFTLLLGDLGELIKADGEDLFKLPEQFQSEDFFAFKMIPAGDCSNEVEVAELHTNPIIVEVRKSVLYSRLICILLDHKKRKLGFFLWKYFNRIN